MEHPQQRTKTLASELTSVAAGKPIETESKEETPKAKAKKKPSKAAKRTRTLRWHRVLRWMVQIAFFLAAPATFSAAFNGMKYVFTQIGSREAIEASAFAVLLVAVLSFTVVFGRFFCGYACAFGTLGDAVYTLFTPLRRLLRLQGKPLPNTFVRALQFLKFAVLAAICILCFTGMWSLVSSYSPWTAFASIIAGSIDGVRKGALAILGGIVLGMAFIERFFCQFLCPLGALFALMPVLPFSAYSRRKDRCGKNCGICKKNCPVSLFPDAGDFAAGECIACGRCADACPLENVTLLRIDKPTSADDRNAKRRVALFKLKGTGIAWVFMRALALLAVLWIVGALSNVPTFTEVTGIPLPWQSR